MSNTRSAVLEFNPQLNKLSKGKELREGLSVVVKVGDTLWVTNDETISLERLSGRKQSADGDQRYDRHEQFALDNYISLSVPTPIDPEEIEEADIEGLDYRDGYLWLVGSHSLKRSKADKKSVEKNFERLATVSKEGNRYLLARIPLVERDGIYSLEKEAEQNGDRRTAAQLPGSAAGNHLTRALAKDNHLKTFLEVPGKDNGFDIEGLAVGDDGRIFLGLRGPVLRGWAVVLELQLEADERNPLELKLKNINPNNPHNPDHPTYRKHFLDLGGLGIRDLCADGSDLLILAGPTLDLDGPVAIFRWKAAMQSHAESVVSGDALQKVIDVPYGQGVDHAEGMTLLSPGGGAIRSVLVVYDSASDERQPPGTSAIKADIFALPE